jgi:hypothetical protein
MNLRINKNLIFLITFFLIIFFWSSIELYLIGIIDLEGDATWYFETAVNKLYDENFYPIYPLFITYVGLDNPYITRIAQFFIILILTLFIFKNIEKRNWSKSSIKLFKIFYVSNIGIYLLAIQLVRDWMLFLLTAIALILFTDERKKVTNTIISFFALLLLLPLSQTLPFILLLSYCVSFIQFDVLKQRSYFKIIIGLFSLLVFYLIFKDNISNLIEKSADVVTGDKVLIDDAAKSNFFIGFFNFLFGPGLIRPLFPSKYYLVYTYYFSFLTWLACLSWMIQFSLSISLVSKNISRLNFSKNFFIFFYTFLVYVSIYVAAFGGPGGLRKRMLAYFIFILCISELFSKYEFIPFGRKTITNTLYILILLISITSIFSL